MAPHSISSLQHCRKFPILDRIIKYQLVFCYSICWIRNHVCQRLKESMATILGCYSFCGLCLILLMGSMDYMAYVVDVLNQSFCLSLTRANKACTRRWGFWRDTKHFSTPQHFSSWTASPSPPQRRSTQTIGCLILEIIY